ncbi:urease accessory protein UreF [Roseobacteraceae bacterium S113]
MTQTLTPEQLLTVTQWLSPAFPVGAFAYSHGLEAAVQTGAVHDATSFQHWLSPVLSHGAGRNDAVLIRLSAQTDTPEALDALNRALQPAAERLLETESMGRALCETVAAVWSPMPQALTYPVALGQSARAMAIPLTPLIQMALHAFAANLTSAAIRLVPLGQTDGQRVLSALTPLCLRIAQETEAATRHDLGTAPLASDIHAMHHATLYSRMFRS